MAVNPSALYGTAQYGQSYYGVLCVSLNSDAYILNIQEETINSDAYILATQEETLTSDAYIKVSGNDTTLISDANIVVPDNQYTISADTFIKVIDNIETLTSDAWINLEFTRNIFSNAYIFVADTALGITSNTFITVLDNTETLTSDSYVFVPGGTGGQGEQTLTSNAYISNLQYSLFSDAYIKVLGTQETINSDSYILDTQNQTLISNASIRNGTSTQTITSVCVVSFPDLAEIMEEGWDEIIEVPEFEGIINYTRYDFDEDNMTGGRSKEEFNTYIINAEVQPMEQTDKLVKTGELQVGDAEAFMPARITMDINGNTIAPSFRPQLGDEFVWKGYRYRIQKIKFERIGNIEIFIDCLCKKIGVEHPSQAWNDNYDEYTSEVRPGGGWS